MTPGELEPPVPFPGKHTRKLQNQSRLLSELGVLMAAEGLEASNILRRNDRLVKESVQLVEPLDAIAFFARHPLTFLAKVNAMATPAEALIRTRPTAYSAIMRHTRSAC